MPSRTLVELLHIAAGLVATVLIVRLAAWGYPLARGTFNALGWVAGAAVMLMGMGPLRKAWRIDQRRREHD
ncbi:hypothetical protein SAMN06297144_2586 [Sphingomonas guangdongensis]|uniref:Uncharacterized protein n=1 Tax=Sphingomonas guangdongensis TaxID=1141890 RepID=A0A285R0U0_9SPHN|nr:hypothetical protein [Sphingomonas guangdongensis]SOB87454.1 hypothetical protein SAMN06297144_2586 [Sphingomonas guangdongensis]